MKRNFIFLAFILFALASKGQVGVINYKLGQCVKCYNATQLISDRIKMPVVFSMPSFRIEDSSEIQEQYNLSSFDFPILYNDSLYNLTRSENGTTFSIISFDGLLLYQKEYSCLDDKALDSFQRVYDSNKVAYNENNQTVDSQNDSLVACFDFDTKSVKIFQKDKFSPILQIRSSDISKDAIIALYPKLEETIRRSFDSIAASNMYTSSIYWAELCGKEVVMLYQFWAFDSPLDTTLYQKSALVIYDFNAKAMNYYRIESEKGRTMFGPFLPTHTADTIYMVTRDNETRLYDQLQSGKPILPITEYVRKADEYMFTRKLNLDLPNIYRDRYLYDFYALNNSEYPYLAFDRCNSIWNMETLEKTEIVSETDSAYIFFVKTGKDFTGDDFTVQNLYVSSKDRVYAMYQINRNYHVAKLIPHTSIRKDFVVNRMFKNIEREQGSIAYASPDYQTRSIIFHFERGRNIRIPVFFFN